VVGGVVGGVVGDASSVTMAQTEVVGAASGWMRRTAGASGVKTAKE